MDEVGGQTVANLGNIIRYQWLRFITASTKVKTTARSPRAQYRFFMANDLINTYHIRGGFQSGIKVTRGVRIKQDYFRDLGLLESCSGFTWIRSILYHAVYPPSMTR
jgi:hypothetical protein